MKRVKKYILLSLTLFLFLIFFNSSSAFADKDDDDKKGNFIDLLDEDAPIGDYLVSTFKDMFTDEEYEPYKYMNSPSDDSEIESGGVVVDIKRYPIERYMVNNEDTSGLFGVNLYSINNMLMGINQNIVKLTDSSLQMFSKDKLDNFADDVENINKRVYDVLKIHFAELFFTILVGYSLFVYLSRASFKESFRKFGIFVIILIVAGYWVKNSSFFIQSFNNLSNEIQSSLVSAGSDLLNIMDDDREGVYADINTIDKDEKVDGTTTVLRNIYFDLAMKKPYLLINYGTTDEDKINENDKIKDLGFGFDEYDRVDRMLSFNLSSPGTSYRMAHANLEVENNDNSSVSSGSSFKQAGLVFMTLIIVVALSVPFIILGLLNYLLQFMALLLTLVLPVVFIISYLPMFQNSIWKSFGNLISIYLAKSFLGILLFLVYLITYVMYILVKPHSVGMYLLHVTCLIMIFYIGIAKRNKIISMITVGRVKSLSQTLPAMNAFYSSQYNNAKERVKNSSPKTRSDSPASKDSNAGKQPLTRTPMKNDQNSSNTSKNTAVAKEKRTPQSKRLKNKDSKNVSLQPVNKNDKGEVNKSSNGDSKIKNLVRGESGKENKNKENLNVSSRKDRDNDSQNKDSTSNKNKRVVSSVKKPLSRNKKEMKNDINYSRKRDEKENEYIEKVTGVSGSTLKNIEVEMEHKMRNDPISKKLRKSVGTDYENKGYGYKNGKENRLNSVEDSRNKR